MANLSSLTNLGLAYRSNEGDMLDDFYVPCMEQTVLYQRATGYFTSGGLVQASQGVKCILENGGRIELVCSPHLDEDDIEAMRAGFQSRESVIQAAVEKSFGTKIPELWHNQLEILSWLIADGRLDVKLALPIESDGQYTTGIYHEKFGLFKDKSEYAEGNAVAFSGSMNETKGGLITNFESIDVFTSWREEPRVQLKEQYFQKLWNMQTPGLQIMPFTEATDQILKPYRASSFKPAKKNEPQVVNKWRHQDEAIAAFLEHERGILEMATGTGKTKTALRITETLLDQGAVDTVIVVMDGNDLLDQWANSLLQLLNKLHKNSQKTTAIKPLLFRSYSHFRELEKFKIFLNSILLCSRENLPKALDFLTDDKKQRTLLIHDEVHGLGSQANRRDLNNKSDFVRYRLGLSATPEREYDEDGNKFIETAVGPVLFRFGLEDAIKRGILSPFRYYPLSYTPSQEDKNAVQRVFQQQAAKKKNGSPMSNEEFWTALARVYKISKTKLPIFNEFIATHQELLERSIIFVEETQYGDWVTEIVHQYNSGFHSYYGGEGKDVLVRFARGDIDSLITCHRLSQGIDIQSLQTVILFASARAQLETIQRIGRCLRIDPSEPGKIAHVVDFIRESSEDDDYTADEERSNFLQFLSNIQPQPEHG